MFDFKLQIGCLIVVLIFMVIYTKATLFTKIIKCNPAFDVLIYVAPWGIIFDGLTAYTVNHLDTVPYWLNLLFHGIFILLMNVLSIAMFIYMIQQTVGFRSKKTKKYYYIPGIISIIILLITIKDLRFEIGEMTNYSMGLSVQVCFATLFLHYLIILIVLLVHGRTIEKRKLFGVSTYMFLSFALIIIQIFLPEVLLTSLVPTVAIICLYITFEDPSLRLLKQHNENIVTGFATLVESRDDSTGGHIHRTKEYVKIILDDLWKLPKYHSVVTKDYVRNVLNAAPMHDIGKMSTPDAILKKPGPLTKEEFEVMKQHAPIGSEIINKLYKEIDDPEYKKITYEIARYHHEKWDGSGYPEGLKEKEIPLHARIMAIADVFDAVSAKRCYRDAMPLNKCFHIIEEGSGKHFDPELVSLFMDEKDKIIECYESNSHL